jgi:hypothetical protein
MAGFLSCRVHRELSSVRFRRLESFGERLVGLLGTDVSAEPVVLCGCSSIHTVGMAYSIDVAFAARDGHVLLAQRAVVPCRMLSAHGAYYVFERPTSEEPWFREGTTIEMTD